MLQQSTNQQRTQSPSYWLTTSYETWPLRSAPLVAYPPAFAQPAPAPAPASVPLSVPVPVPVPAPGPAAAPEKLMAATAAEQTPKEATPAAAAPAVATAPLAALPLAATPALYYQQPAQLVLLNSPYYAATAAAAYSLPLAYVAPSGVQAELSKAAKVKQAEPTTAKPSELEAGSAESADSNQSELEIETLPELQAETPTMNDIPNDLSSDDRLRAAIGKINPNYVIEEIVPIPGKHVISSTQQQAQQGYQAKANALPIGGKQKVPGGKLRKLVNHKAAQQQQQQQAQQQQQQHQRVKVESKGSTRTMGNIPQIPFGTYFLPYNSGKAQAINGRKQAALILEPHSKAVVGNGGTAISTPISKALLKKGVPTNVYFNPESVAIAGVGGKAHAAADLELDLFN